MKPVHKKWFFTYGFQYQKVNSMLLIGKLVRNKLWILVKRKKGLAPLLLRL